MNPTSKTVLVSLIASAASVGVYHVAFSPKGSAGRAPRSDSPGSALDEAVAALRRDVDALRQRGPAESTTGGASAETAGALAARLEALERRVIPASADSGARELGQLPPGVADRPAAWTEEQIASFRALLDEVEHRRTVDRETTSYRDLVRRVDPNLAPADESAAVSLLANFMRTVRGVFAGASAGATPEERAASSEKAAAARAKLLVDLGAILRKDVVDGLAQHLPTFATPVGKDPPIAPEPTMDGSK